MNTNTYTNPTIPPKPEEPSRFKSIAKKGWPVALAAVIGIGIGGAVAGYDTSTPGKQASAPAPKVVTETVTPEPKVVTETVRPEPEVITEEVTVEVVDPTCRAVADELFSIMQVYTEEVTIPYSDIVITLGDQLQYGADARTIDGVTAKLEGINATTQDLTSRVEALSPDYIICSAGAGE